MKDYKFAKFININGKFKAFNNQEELIKLYADGLNDLQSKIDKANKILSERYEEDKKIFNANYDFKFILDFEEEMLEILGDKENE